MRIGKLECTAGFFLLLAWLNYFDRQMVIPFTLLGCMLHELGHYGAMRAMGIEIKEIRLTAVGAEIVTADTMSYWQEGTAALAGPAVNLLLARLACLWDGGAFFAGINIVLGIFNLLPIGQLDGGKTLHCALCLISGPAAADWVEEVLSGVITILVFAMGVMLVAFQGNITLLCVSVWLLMLRRNQRKA